MQVTNTTSVDSLELEAIWASISKRLGARRRRARIAVIAIGALVAAGVSGGIATSVATASYEHPHPAPKVPSSAQQIGNQVGGGTEDAEDMASEITGLVDPSQGGSDHESSGRPYGYTGVELNGDGLILYWAGEVPDSIRRILERGSAHSEFLVSTKYTYYQERTAMNRVLAAVDSHQVPSGVKVTAESGRIDGSGIDVEYYGLPQTTEESAHLSRIFTSIAGMPAAALAGGAPLF